MAANIPNNNYADALTLDEARDRFLVDNGFRFESYSAPAYTIKFGHLSLRLPNTKAHQWATPLHDIHHVLTGYGTDWIGEAEVAAWELRAGCKTFVVYFLDIAGVMIGLFISPIRVWRAFVKAKGQRTLYSESALSCLSDTTVGQLRAKLGIPAGGLK